MVSSLLGLGSSSPGFRRPTLEVSFGSGSADDWQQAIVSVMVELGLAPSADVVEVRLSGSSPAPDPAVGDSGSVSLGYEDSSPELVFTGQVEGVQHNIHGVTRITATNGGVALSRLRVNQSYEEQTAGQIASDLAQRAGVTTGTIQDGVSFPFYVIDDRRSAYQHIAALATKSGFVAYVNPDGDLDFGPLSETQAVQTFTYGEDILSLEVNQATPALGAVETIGEGAAGSQGKEAWSWLVKDPSSVTGSAGDGTPERQHSDPSLRNSDAAQSAADGMSNAAGLLNITGTLLVPGSPLVAVGITIEIASAPQNALNGACLVRRVRHQYTKRTGFSTLVGFSKTGEGGAGALGGLL